MSTFFVFSGEIGGHKDNTASEDDKLHIVRQKARHDTLEIQQLASRTTFS